MNHRLDNKQALGTQESANLAMMEALVGQLYPATLLARLVTLHIATERTKKDH